mmetsp:Transcript_11231/g.45482  ORF Transcript_11231/g.45482 Transcript_11231/m.45482 type:complete len:556 (-) Transcript_11231:223-1890(-)
MCNRTAHRVSQRTEEVAIRHYDTGEKSRSQDERRRSDERISAHATRTDHLVPAFPGTRVGRLDAADLEGGLEDAREAVAREQRRAEELVLLRGRDGVHRLPERPHREPEHLDEDLAGEQKQADAKRDARRAVLAASRGHDVIVNDVEGHGRGAAGARDFQRVLRQLGDAAREREGERAVRLGDDGRQVRRGERDGFDVVIVQRRRRKDRHDGADGLRQEHGPRRCVEKVGRLEVAHQVQGLVDDGDRQRPERERLDAVARVAVPRGEEHDHDLARRRRDVRPRRADGHGDPDRPQRGRHQRDAGHVVPRVEERAEHEERQDRTDGPAVRPPPRARLIFDGAEGFGRRWRRCHWSAVSQPRRVKLVEVVVLVLLARTTTARRVAGLLGEGARRRRAPTVRALEQGGSGARRRAHFHVPQAPALRPVRVRTERDAVQRDDAAELIHRVEGDRDDARHQIVRVLALEARRVRGEPLALVLHGEAQEHARRQPRAEHFRDDVSRWNDEATAQRSDREVDLPRVLSHRGESKQRHSLETVDGPRQHAKRHRRQQAFDLRL